MVLISFIRGINVGGKNLIRMAELTAMYETLGLRRARSFLQSGNIVCESGDGAAEAAQRIEEAIRRSFGLDVRTMVRTASELKKVLAHNPFPAEAAADPSHLLVMFLDRAPDPAAKACLAGVDIAPEKLSVSGREVYLWYPNGVGRSKLARVPIERLLGAAGTARNWNTVTKLVKIAESLGPTKCAPTRSRCAASRNTCRSPGMP